MAARIPRIESAATVDDASRGRAYGVATVGGLMLWILASVVGGKAEPWDASIYWTLCYPLAIALSGALGYAYPHRPWRWALTVMFSQALVMLVAGSGFGMLPFGLVFLGVLSLPALALARVCAKARLRKSAEGNA